MYCLWNNLWLINLDNKFELRNSLFDAVILTENAYPNKYSYSEYGIGFDAWGNSSFVSADTNSW